MNKIILHNDIKDIVKSFYYLSDTSYIIDGLNRDIASINIVDSSNVLTSSLAKEDEISQKFINILTTDIYNNFYNVDKTTLSMNSVYKNDNFIIDLSQANSGEGTWEGGWMLVGKDDSSNKLIVKKNNICFWIENENFIKIDESNGMVKIEKEIRFLNPHFYYAFGNTSKMDLKQFENQQIRFYWNLTPEGAINYIKLITQELNKKQIFFSTKVISDYSQYQRSDAGVLYIDISQINEALPIIKNIHKILRNQLKESVPMFVKKIGKGLGFAEDPMNGMSFGISRSKIIAETLYNSFKNGIESKSLVEYQLSETFEKLGISALKPYSTLKRLDDFEYLFNNIQYES